MQFRTFQRSTRKNLHGSLNLCQITRAVLPLNRISTTMHELSFLTPMESSRWFKQSKRVRCPNSSLLSCQRKKNLCLKILNLSQKDPAESTLLSSTGNYCSRPSPRHTVSYKDTFAKRRQHQRKAMILLIDICQTRQVPTNGCSNTFDLYFYQKWMSAVNSK